MDTAGLVMWLDLVVKPFQQKLGKRMLIVGDNCGSHKTLAVRRAFEETDAAGCVTKKEMAANITDCKQVCDMAFNGAVKQKIVAQRVAHLYDELQAYKLKHDEDKTAVFKPAPIPTHATMQMVMRAYASYAEDGNFKAGITRAFVKAGSRTRRRASTTSGTASGSAASNARTSSSSRSRRRTRWA